MLTSIKMWKWDKLLGKQARSHTNLTHLVQLYTLLLIEDEVSDPVWWPLRWHLEELARAVE